MRIVVIGGLGHVGLPLSLQLAHAGHDVSILDTNVEAREAFTRGHALFDEPGISDAIHNLSHRITLDTQMPQADVVILSTNSTDMLNILQNTDVSIEVPIIVRQTTRPGDLRGLQAAGYTTIFAPERLAQGLGMQEIATMPQMIGCDTDEQFELAERVFIWTVCLRLTLEEAELAKLFCNYWRHGTFALANDMYMIAEASSCDFYRIRDAIMYDYPRMQGFPRAGFSGGFCLPKDTGYIAQYAGSELAYIVNATHWKYTNEIKRKLAGCMIDRKSVGILGLAAKANNDDLRTSLYAELNEFCTQYGIPMHDPYLKHISSQHHYERVLRCDVVIVAMPHAAYTEAPELISRDRSTIIDLWGVLS